MGVHGEKRRDGSAFSGRGKFFQETHDRYGTDTGADQADPLVRSGEKRERVFLDPSVGVSRSEENKLTRQVAVGTRRFHFDVDDFVVMSDRCHDGPGSEQSGRGGDRVRPGQGEENPVDRDRGGRNGIRRPTPDEEKAAWYAR